MAEAAQNLISYREAARRLGVGPHVVARMVERRSLSVRRLPAPARPRVFASEVAELAKDSVRERVEAA
jgi:transposase